MREDKKLDWTLWQSNGVLLEPRHSYVITNPLDINYLRNYPEGQKKVFDDVKFKFSIETQQLLDAVAKEFEPFFYNIENFTRLGEQFETILKNQQFNAKVKDTLND